jgi:hypothetical protein
MVAPNGDNWAITPCRTASGQTQTRTFAPPPPLPNFRHSFTPALTALGA